MYKQMLEQMQSLSVSSNTTNNTNNFVETWDGIQIPILKLKDLKSDKLIGEGNNTKVVLREKTDGIKYVTKIIMQKGEPSQPPRIFENEVGILETLKNVNSNNIIKMYDHYFGYDPAKGLNLYCIDMEHVNRGSLDQIITEQKKGEFSFSVKMGWMADIARALDYLHDPLKIIHYDIKPGNILLQLNPDGSFTIKLCDFAISSTSTEVAWGTLMWMAPETLAYRFDLNSSIEMKGSSTAADIYSLGLIGLSIYNWNLNVSPKYFKTDKRYGEITIEYDDVRKFAQERVDGVTEPIPESAPLKLVQFLTKTWILNPEARLTAKQAEILLQELQHEAKDNTNFAYG